MNDKISRNDPCPCGSGKKYKKCCLPKDEQLASHNLQTGTILDEYFFIFRGVAIYGEGLLKSIEYGVLLNSVTEKFERDFTPGKENGSYEGDFFTWFYLDYRFGTSNKTICERFIEEGYSAKLNDTGPELVKNISRSCCTFYEVTNKSEDKIVFQEIGTGKIWNVVRVNEPYERDTVAGEVWFVRFVGKQDEAYIFTAPYVFKGGDKFRADITSLMKLQMKYYSKSKKERESESEEDIFINSCKFLFCPWLSKAIGKEFIDTEKKTINRPMPELCNTDGDQMEFTKTHYKIVDEENLRKKLSSIKTFEYDEHSKLWVWTKKGNKRFKDCRNTILGNISIDGQHLIAETNSLNRAIKLREILLKRIKGSLLYEKMEARDFASMPEPLPEEVERHEKEQKELNSKPETRMMLKKFTEDYYNKQWIKSRVPALDNKTPLQAMKTERGRSQVMALIDEFEITENSMHGKAFKFDFNELRKNLGLPVNSRTDTTDNRDIKL